MNLTIQAIKRWLRTPRIAAVLCALTFALPVAAADAQDPYKMVEQTTQRVLTIIGEGKGYYDKEPARFNKQVDVVMSEVVDFDSFARGVMGPYANLQRLTTDAEKAQRRDQMKRFSDTFKNGLIETYAKGLLKFNGQRIETLPPRKGDDANSNSISVVQNIYGSGDKPYIVQYSMRKNAESNWKVMNVIIEGINLGQTYRNQFAAAVDQNRGDIDKVIANWKVEPQTDGAVADNNKGAQ
ncbi:MAG TPA: ABC transporter substrate-binding protein [Spongiibacteraceae bacterium]|nr:ABC transporter substrate-binding protein [Spongiibacteraceae bacterium]